MHPASNPDHHTTIPPDPDAAITIELTAAQICTYHREGYLALPALTTPDEIAWLSAAYDHHFAARSGRDQGQQFDLLGDDRDAEAVNVPQILGLSTYVPEIRTSLLWRNAQAVLGQLFGTPPDYMGDHAINKPAHCPKATPWHQDEAYWDGQCDHFAASIWIPLQAVDERNGCMHFVPRSHWEELLPHRSENGNPAVHGLELDGDFSQVTGRAVACPLPAGGCTIHHQRTLHYTTPNRTDRPRRAWILVGGLRTQRRQAPRRLPWEEAKRTLRDQRARGHVRTQAAMPMRAEEALD